MGHQRSERCSECPYSGSCSPARRSGDDTWVGSENCSAICGHISPRAIRRFPPWYPSRRRPVVCEMWSRTTSQAQIRSWMLGQPLAPEAGCRCVGEGDPCNGILIDRRLSAPRHSQKTCVTPPPQHASFERQASKRRIGAGCPGPLTAGTAKARMSGEGQACADLSGPAGGKTPRTARPSHSDHPPHSALT